MGRDKRLEVDELTLDSGEFWVIAGPGGSGKSSMARAISGAPDKSGYHTPISGLLRTDPHDNKEGGAWISFDMEREIRDSLRHNDDSEVLGRPDEGTTLESFLGGSAGKLFLHPELLEKLEGRGIKHLSTGEFRQVFIAREAGKKPALAVLDEPFEGLDIKARERLTEQLAEWSESETLIVLTVNRMEDIPPYASGLVLLCDDRIAAQGIPSEILESPLIKEIFGNTSNFREKRIIPPPPEAVVFEGKSLIEMKRVSLSFNGRRVLENVNWVVKPGESWLLTGPNGSGKTTLLNLISGEEPRGYGQDLKLFGRKRGSGESTSEIKKYIGQVSASLQDSVSRHATPGEVIGSGLRDSLLLTIPLDGFETGLVEQWLELLGLKKNRQTAFYRLPYGERRLAMIGRAMIKHPPLLLLDEPMHGLDKSSRDRMRYLIDTLIRETQTTVLFVSHRSEDAPDSITRTIRLTPSDGSGPSGAEITQDSLNPL